jgi:GNAT superfamily N-acetyltransferase
MRRVNPSASQRADIEIVTRDAWLDIYAAAPADVGEALGIEYRTIDDGALLISRALDNLQFNRLSALGTLRPASGEAIETAIAAFHAAGVRDWVIQAPDDHVALRELCTGRGLQLHERKWARFIRHPGRIDAPTTLEIRHIGRDAAADFGSIASKTFGLPSVASPWIAALVARPKWHCFVAYEGNTPAATGAMYVDGKAAWLGIGTTLASFRQRGAQSALLATRINAASDAGCEVITVETGLPNAGESSPSLANITRAGFQLSHIWENFCQARQ